jgi:hypothetical protein
LLLLTAIVASAQQSSVPLGARLKMRWREATVYLREGDNAHELSIRDQFDAALLENVALQSAKEANGFIYLLLDVTGPSTRAGGSQVCGAGSESNLIWLKLDKDWKRLDAENFLYDSCRSGYPLVVEPQWQGDTLTVTAGAKVATYSYKRPEEGLKISAVPPGK